MDDVHSGQRPAIPRRHHVDERVCPTRTLPSGKYDADEESGGHAWSEPKKQEEEEDEDGGNSNSGISYWYKRTVYISDTYLSQAIYQSYALFVMAIILTISGGAAYAAVDPNTELIDGCWAAFTWIAAGVLGGYINSPYDIPTRTVASCVTILGILYFSIVLGLVVEAVQAKMNALREGRSLVVEKEHTVMLGWTEKSLLFIKEIINANESEGGGVIAVLCEEGKEKMDKELAHFISKKELMGTQVVFRQGTRLMASDLDKVSVATARSVVVLSDSNLEPDKADAEVLQVILNLSNLKMDGHVVAEVRDKDNEALIHLIGRGNVETVVSHDIIGRLMLMSVRQPGLAEVYGSVLGFDGDEFYTETWPELAGVPFGDVQLMMPDAIPIGVRPGGDGAMILNPRHDYIMAEDDELVVIAEDNDTYKPEEKHVCKPGTPPIEDEAAGEKEFIFFAGWRRDLRDIILLLDALCPAGSEIHIMAGVALSQRDALLFEAGLDLDSLQNIELIHHVGNTAMRRHLEAINILKFTSCIIFADEEEEGDIMQSDSKCLATLLLIRDIQTKKRLQAKSSMTDSPVLTARSSGGSTNSKKGQKDDKIPIVTEILDPKTQQTILGNPEMRAVSDFLQSNDMVSKILAMVCEDRSVKLILDEMLSPEGSAMACVPASKYCNPGEELSYFQMACRCQQYGEILLGYLKPDESESTGYQAPLINSKEKSEVFCWDDYVCCLLTGGPATEAIKPDLPPKEEKKLTTTAARRRVRLDSVERKHVQNIVQMAEVKLTQMAPEPRVRACAQIMAFINGSVLSVDVSSPQGDALDSGILDSPMNPVDRFVKAEKTSDSPNSHLDAGRKLSRSTSNNSASGGNGGIVVANGTLAPKPAVNARANTQNFTEAGEYADYVAEKLMAMPAMRRNQVVQVVDLLSDAFACGQSVPATRLLGVISSFQALPGRMQSEADVLPNPSVNLGLPRGQ